MSRAFLRFVFERNGHVLLFTESKTAHAELLRFVGGTTMSTTIVTTATSTAEKALSPASSCIDPSYLVNFFNFVSSGAKKRVYLQGAFEELLENRITPNVTFEY